MLGRSSASSPTPRPRSLAPAPRCRIPVETQARKRATSSTITATAMYPWGDPMLSLAPPCSPLYYLAALSHTESRVQEHGPRTTCTCSSLEAACGATAACADEEASRRLRMSRRPEACRRLRSRQPAGGFARGSLRRHRSVRRGAASIEAARGQLAWLEAAFWKPIRNEVGV